MKVGPKGQVVIPKTFRNSLGIQPGSEVFVELTGNTIKIERQTRDVVKDMERIAKSGRNLKSIDMNKEYDQMMEERWKKIKKLVR